MVVLKQLGAGPELVHCHFTLTLEAYMSRTVTLVGVGGDGGIKNYSIYLMKGRLCNLYVPLAGMETILEELVLLNCPPSA